MSSTSQENKRIAKNTMLLYVRMLFIMIVSLYTSRVILRELGVENYGKKVWIDDRWAFNAAMRSQRGA